MAAPQQDNAAVGAEGEVKNGQPSNFTAEEDTWSEERLEQAMSTLQDMHIQLRSLRTTIPRLIAPLTTKHPSPESLFREFSASVGTANQEVQQFKKLMTDEQSNKILEEAKKSRARNPKGIKPWIVTEHSDWLSRDR